MVHEHCHLLQNHFSPELKERKKKHLCQSCANSSLSLFGELAKVLISENLPCQKACPSMVSISNSQSNLLLHIVIPQGGLQMDIWTQAVRP